MKAPLYQGLLWCANLNIEMIKKDRWNKLKVGDVLVSRNGTEYEILATYDAFDRTVKVYNFFSKENNYQYLLPNDGKRFKTVRKK